MTGRAWRRAPCVVALCVIAVLSVASSPPPAARIVAATAACPPAPAGVARCLADIAVPAVASSTSPTGYGPADLRTAYGLAGTSGQGRLIAVVDAFDDPAAESDLATYRAAFGLPPCTTANGCFRKLDSRGGTSYPRTDVAWAREVSLDLDMVSAACPDCHLVLLEAKSPAIPDLGLAVNTAAGLPGVAVISNSYGVPESAQETGWDAYYNHPRVAITAASGDGSYGTGFPAASPLVTAVGGTTLQPAPGTARGWTENPWSGASSGCSAYEPKPSWQHDSGCARRSIADVSADADPGTGVAMYDSYQASGWMTAGGTSAAAAFIAGVYALAGNSSSVVAGSYPYGHPAALNQVGAGGYSFTGGLGSPQGTGAF